MSQPDKPSSEITLPGIRDTFLPTTWADGRGIVYFCHWCESKPEVEENQIAVIANHDACQDRRLAEIILSDPNGYIAEVFSTKLNPHA